MGAKRAHPRRISGRRQRGLRNVRFGSDQLQGADKAALRAAAQPNSRVDNALGTLAIAKAREEKGGSLDLYLNRVHARFKLTFNETCHVLLLLLLLLWTFDADVDHICFRALTPETNSERAAVEAPGAPLSVQHHPSTPRLDMSMRPRGAVEPTRACLSSNNKPRVLFNSAKNDGQMNRHDRHEEPGSVQRIHPSLLCPSVSATVHFSHLL